jgi:hypothetical protein
VLGGMLGSRYVVVDERNQVFGGAEGRFGKKSCNENM